MDPQQAAEAFSNLIKYKREKGVKFDNKNKNRVNPGNVGQQLFKQYKNHRNSGANKFTVDSKDSFCETKSMLFPDELKDNFYKQSGSSLYCEPCDKEFYEYKAYNAHLATHEKCKHPDCIFEGTRKVVIAHFHAAHGNYSGTGFKWIDVEGKKFRVLLGASPEEIEQWRSERKKKYPTLATIATKKIKLENFVKAGGFENEKDIATENIKMHPTKENDSDDFTRLPRNKKSINNNCLKFGKQKFGLFLPEPLDSDKRGTLMSKLLENEILLEESTILQCIRYIRQNMLQ